MMPGGLCGFRPLTLLAGRRVWGFLGAGLAGNLVGRPVQPPERVSGFLFFVRSYSKYFLTA